MIWTLLGTFTASYTFLFINHSNTIYYMDRIELTRCHTGTKSHTAKGACLVAASWNRCGSLTVRDTVIICLEPCFIAGTVTFYKGYHFYCLTGIDTHNGSDLLSDCCAAHRAGIYRSFSCCDRLCKGITACITTATTVIARKELPDLDLFLVYRHCQLNSRKSQKKTNQNTDNSN